MTEMTREERQIYDARAEYEAWEHAHEILEPMLEIARVFGSPELTRVMEEALAEIDGEINRTLDVLEDLLGKDERRADKS